MLKYIVIDIWEVCVAVRVSIGPRLGHDAVAPSGRSRYVVALDVFVIVSYYTVDIR